MRRPRPPAPPVRLLPAGRRWGRGAQSVVPYLTEALSTRPGEDAAIRNPVFPQMEKTLRALRRRH